MANRAGKTELFAEWQQGAMVVSEQSFSTGDRWWVGSAETHAGDTIGHGRSPETPFATLDYAIAYCTADKNDIIYVMPGHTETISAAGGLTLDVAGITIYGLGNGYNMPTITLDTDIATDVDVDAMNITVKHIKFVAGLADITAAIDVNACNTTFVDCQFFGDGAGLNALIWMIDANNVDYLTVKDCFFYDPDASNTHCINFAGDGFGHLITGNRMFGDWGTMAIGGAGVVICATISNNYIQNAAAVNDTCINMAGDGGWIVGNMVVSPQAQANAITAVAMGSFQNFESVDAEDLSGALEPVVT